MRITSGKFGGRNILIPKTGDIRPTQDRVREALFSMLMNEIASSRFLDLFAGSGAVGLEAISRGAASATFVESSSRHIDTLKKNIATLETPNSRELAQATSIFRQDVFSWMNSFSSREPFDIVFADPPYQLAKERTAEPFLEALESRNILRKGGLFVFETATNLDSQAQDGWQILKVRDYGATRLTLFSSL